MCKARLLVFATVCAALGVVGQANVQAAISTGDWVTIQTSGTVSPAGTLALLTGGEHTSDNLVGHGGGGGEFYMKITTSTNAASVGQGYITFCLERNEYIYPSGGIAGPYAVVIADSAVAGGVGGASGGQDPLSDATKWLFQQYSLGTLDTAVSGFSYNSNSAADALQNAIWYLENEITTALSGLYGNLVTAAQSATYNASLGAVRVAQLWQGYNSTTGEGTGTKYQDQLVFIPAPIVPTVAPVPEPSSVLAWSMFAMCGYGASLWRRRRK